MQLKSHRLQQHDFQSHEGSGRQHLTPLWSAGTPWMDQPLSKTHVAAVPPIQTSVALAERRKFTFEQGPTKNIFFSQI